MSIRNCMFPWHWMVVSNDGDVLPCGHGSRPVGNLRESSADEVWNGAVMQEVRAAILANEVHDICRSTDCPYQQTNHAFSPPPQALELDEELVRSFDEQYYLEAHADIAEAVRLLRFASGLEHFARNGRAEGRAYRLIGHVEGSEPRPIANAMLALLEYSRGATYLRSRPVDLVLAVSTICNLGCVMCPHGRAAVDRPRHMPLPILERAQGFLDVAARMIISGLGEPLLAPGFWHVVERVADRSDLFIRVNSNGHFLTSDKAERLLASGVKEISFSLDAASAETYQRIRGGDFERAVRGVELMCEARRNHAHKRLEIFINMTLMRENVAEAEAFVELGARLGVDAVLFSQLFPFGDQPTWQVKRGNWTFSYSEQMLVRVPELARKHLTAAQRRADQLGVRIILQSNTDQFVAKSEPALL